MLLNFRFRISGLIKGLRLKDFRVQAVEGVGSRDLGLWSSRASRVFEAFRGGMIGNN